MPRGNPNVWRKHGSSYAELAGTTTSVERAHELAPRRLPPVTPGLAAELRSQPAAGALATVTPRGAGSFVMQTGWSLGVPAPRGAWTSSSPAGASSSRSADGSAGMAAGGAIGGATGSHVATSSSAAAAPLVPSSSSAAAAAKAKAAAAAAARSSCSASGLPPRTYATETRTNFQAPPSDCRRTRSAGPLPSQMPMPNHPNDWCTSKQLEYRPDRYAGAQRQQPIPHRDSGRLLPQDVPQSDTPAHFTSQQRTAFPGRSSREAAAIVPSGCRATQAAGYNIITGAAVPYVNNAFEHWDGRDYRRHR